MVVVANRIVARRSAHANPPAPLPGWRFKGQSTLALRVEYISLGGLVQHKSPRTAGAEQHLPVSKSEELLRRVVLKTSPVNPFHYITAPTTAVCCYRSLDVFLCLNVHSASSVPLPIQSKLQGHRRGRLFGLNCRYPSELESINLNNNIAKGKSSGSSRRVERSRRGDLLSFMPRS